MGTNTSIARKFINLPDKNDRERLAVTLSNVLSPEECQEWITRSEEKGYTTAALPNASGGRQVLDTEYRDSQQCIIDSRELAEKLFVRIKPYLPSTWRRDRLELVGLNEQLRFLRYDPGQKCLPHIDRRYHRSDGSEEISFLTLQLYLNEGFKGGRTTFIEKKNPKHRVSFPIKTGMVFIFEHRIFHEESPVEEGHKYLMKTDVMYRPTKYNEP